MQTHTPAGYRSVHAGFALQLLHRFSNRWSPHELRVRFHAAASRGACARLVTTFTGIIPTMLPSSLRTPSASRRTKPPAITGGYGCSYFFRARQPARTATARCDAGCGDQVGVLRAGRADAVDD